MEKVISIGKTYILFENNNIGHIVYVPIPKFFEENKEIKLFIYEYNSEYQSSIYGFKTFKDRILFEDLISVNGVGPKTSLSILQNGYDKVSKFIAQGDITAISNLRHMGEKSANQVVIELSGKYKSLLNLKDNQVLPSEISSSLKTLGFNNDQIKYATEKIKPSENIESMIEEAIILISNAK